ncbi:hypothetical protein D3C83_126080 [compost metagenome]
MNGSGDEFLTAAAFADDKNGSVGRGDFLDHAIHLLHRFGVSVQTTKALALVAVFDGDARKLREILRGSGFDKESVHGEFLS